jgi:hypothetical protein
MAVYSFFLLQMSSILSPSQSGDPFVLVLFKYFHNTSQALDILKGLVLILFQHHICIAHARLNVRGVMLQRHSYKLNIQY